MRNKAALPRLATLVAATFWLATALPTGFTPSDDFGFVNLNVSLPPGSTMNDSRRVADEVRERLVKYPEVVHVTTTLSPRSANRSEERV